MYKKYSPTVCREYLQYMRIEMSAINMAIDIAKIIFDLFQMAILPSFLKRLASEGLQ